MNKSIKIFTAAAGLALLAIGSSCNKLKDFGTTNANPAAVTEIIPYALLTGVERQLGAFASNARAAVTVQYYSEAEYPSFGQYAIPQVDFGPTYNTVLYDLQQVINNSANPAELSMARMMKAYIFWTITDRWGDIPYETALQGKVPTYSKQEVIYKDMIKELTEAVAQMPASGSQRGDIMYGNTTAQFANWKRLGNSLRMLMAMRLSKRYPGASDYAATEFKAALNDPAGSIDDNSSNFVLTYFGGGGEGSPYSNQFWYTSTQLRDYGLSQPIFTILSGINDPRAAVFGSSSTAVPYGLNEGLINAWRQNNPGWAKIFAPAYREEKDPVFIITAAETLLARAEAADRGWTPEVANTVYTAGITAAFTMWGLPAPTPAYLADANVALTAATGTGANLKNIATQFYLAAFPDGTMGWSNYRRTGFPLLANSPYPLSTTHTTLLRRFTYGTAEYSTNLANVTLAAATITGGVGGDVQEGHVWWDL